MENMKETDIDIAGLRMDMTDVKLELRSHTRRHDESIKELKTQVFKTSGASLNPQPKPLSLFNGNLEEEEQPDLVF
ncbi:hypothetical protein NEIRO03_2610 [Nematocida sp. AWRm78]|nr:hypothetical protein NEIRO03_2610 [Nematocida sp. AWRm78]